MRTGLPDGAVITLNHDGISRAFRIERTIGEGASCIAYEATLVDGSNAGLRCRVKECYPYHAAITRRGSALAWESGDERDRAFQKLRTTHELLLRLRNNDEIGNSIVSTSLYEGNGTLYMVMDLNHAVTYDMDGDVSLHETLDTIRVLAAHIGQLHQMGYLHLDIKPGNFLVRHHPSTAVWLFDVDSFTSLQEIVSGNAVSYPYSRGCAAPEQLCGKTRKLCPATDIFAIGAVLFTKIMGRPVCNEDMGLFADWMFDGELFDSVNPRVKRILKELFHKTLAASPSRRFQTVDELLGTIKAALDVTVEGKPYLRSSGISNTIHFVGRENEIGRIHESFAEGKHAVFLHGEGGMGKSCTAIAYGEAYRDEYDAVIFLRYRDSLPETLNRIEICNFDAVNVKEREQTLRRLLDNRVLLIIDNFDVEIDQDEYLPELIDYPAHILITSRTDFVSAYEGSVAQIEVGRLTDEQALDIFAHASRLDAETLAHSEGYAKLCRRVEYNTLLLELMGRQCAASCISADELWHQMKPGLNQSERMEKVWTKKDGSRTRRTIYSALRVLYDVASLNEGRQRALQNLCVLRFLNIDRDAYCRFTHSKTIDVLNELVELGWVQKREGLFVLHSMIDELVQNELHPDKHHCAALQEIEEVIWDTLDKRKEYAEYEYEYKYYTDFLCEFAVSADLQNVTMRQMVFQWLDGLMTADEDDCLDSSIGLPSPMDERYGRLYSKLADLVNTCNLTDEEIANIRCICFLAWASCYHCYARYEDREKYCRERDEGCRLAYTALMDFLNSAPAQLVDGVVDRIAQYLSFVNPIAPVEYIHSMYSLYPRAFDPYEDLREKYGLPLSSEQAKGWGIPKRCEELWRTSMHYEQVEPYIKAYQVASDKRDYIERLMQDESLSLGERAELISECIGAVFLDPEKGLHQRYRQIDWEEQAELLETEEAFLFSDVWKDSSDENSWSRQLAARRNIINQTVTYARLGRLDDFEACVTYIFDLMKDRAQEELDRSKDMPYRMLIHDSMIFCYEMYGAVCALHDVDRACYAVPMLHTYIEGWLEYVRKLPIFKEDDEREFIKLYNVIIVILEAASTEDNIPAQYQMPYDEMIAEYKRRIEELTDTGYQIKTPEDE